MASRMDRYKSDTKEFEVVRSKSNKNLYKNIPNIKTTNRNVYNNEYDISDLKNNVATTREQYKKNKALGIITPVDTTSFEEKSNTYEKDIFKKSYFDEEMTFDINHHLEKAKKENEDVMKRYHKLTETVASGMAYIDIEKLEKRKENYIADTPKKSENSLEILDFLKPEKNDEEINKPITEIEKTFKTKPFYEEETTDEEKELLIDKTFFTSTLKLKNSDFVGNKTSHVKTIILIFIALVLIAILIGSIYMLIQNV
ncbi:MAG: hypothetical protein ACK5HL_02715 [Bacilli bacterium]